MTDETLAQLGAVVGAAGSVLVILPPPRRAVLLAGFALLACAEAMLALALLPREDLERLTSAAGALALAGGVLAVAAGAWAFVRHPAAVPVAVLAAAPFRLPVSLGSQEAFLLLPLYLVVAAAALALLYRCVRGETPAELPRWLSVPAGALIAWASVSLLWAMDVEQGSIALLFFVFPFSALLAVVARSPVAAWAPRALAIVLVGLGTVFAAVGLYQAWTHTLLFAQDLRVANAYTSYFRVTSLFKDPSIYGRSLVLAIALLVTLLWLGRIGAAPALALAAVLFAGLYYSYSQSSMVVLFAIVLAVTLLLADRASRTTVAAVAVAIAVVGSALAVAAARDDGLGRATAGRSRLVSVTGRVIANHPVAGVGIGSQPVAARREAETRRRAAKNASHTTPLTITAELGLVGLVLYVAFLGGAARLLFEVTRARIVIGLGLTVSFFVLFLHSLFYSGFFEDPIMWGILGFAVAVAAVPVPTAERRLDPSADTSLLRRLEARWHT